MNRGRRLLRPAVGLVLLALVVARVGTGPLLDGLHRASPAALAAALAITALTTACCAWRWRVVARALGATLPVSVSVAAYYRSQLLNSTLPGGVVGDVDRGLHQGFRAVAWERTLGQIVQVTLTVLVVLVLAAPLRPALPAAAGTLAGLVLLAVVALRHPPRRFARAARALADDLVACRRSWFPVAVASAGSATGHVVVFLVAARAAGVTAGIATLVPVACVVLLAATLPINLAGWGPREGAAAWAFAAVGLRAADGVTVSVVYGVMAFVATLPGVAVLLGGRRTGVVEEVARA